jgi:hypothetical protein
LVQDIPPIILRKGRKTLFCAKSVNYGPFMVIDIRFFESADKKGGNKYSILFYKTMFYKICKESLKRLPEDGPLVSFHVVLQPISATILSFFTCFNHNKKLYKYYEYIRLFLLPERFLLA